MAVRCQHDLSIHEVAETNQNKARARALFETLYQLVHPCHRFSTKKVSPPTRASHGSGALICLQRSHFGRIGLLD
jgi:hypothetical protein